MLLFSGHHKANQGAKNSETSEFLEASIICNMVYSKCDIEYFTDYTIKQKLNIINTICDSLSIEVHFSVASHETAGAFVYHQPNNELSEKSALIFQKYLNAAIGVKNNAAIGFYHGKEQYGLDYFLRTDAPAILINLEHWNNYKTVSTDRNNYVNAIVGGIENLISLNKG